MSLDIIYEICHDVSKISKEELIEQACWHYQDDKWIKDKIDVVPLALLNDSKFDHHYIGDDQYMFFEKFPILKTYAGTHEFRKN